ncbi:MAG TPA: patatin-like phospholipase family protein [Caldimonas sp.]|nr:patatin-like phospholipase family protein [Caldimonas sp.]HEV7578314.1 patatin-like phospholipase family protein [Caldimonas sp.]
MSTSGYHVLIGVLLLLFLQCLIGIWTWRLAANGRVARRELARTKARDALVLARIEAHQRSILAKLGELPPAAPNDNDARLSPKLGIALSGGGGKGAYQVGVLRVLRAAGLRPDAIAGTSVGAINATLLCLDDLEVAADFWSQVSFWQVAKVGVANLAAAPLLVFALITGGSWDDVDGRMRRVILFRFYATLVPVNITAIFLGASVLVVVGSVVGCAAVVTLGYLANPLVGRLGLALLNNAPLAAQIQDKVPPARIRAARTPLYVTVAARRSIVDPDSPHWLDSSKRTLVARQPYVPEYRRLQDESPNDIQRIVLQSAAIPFGVFPLRRIGDSGYVDGGVTDNVPIQPLIDAGCTRIIVVHLNHDAACDGWRLTDPDDLWTRLGALRELRRLAGLGRDHTFESLVHEARLREAWSPDEQRKERSAHVAQDYGRSSVEFVHVVPTESLGTFLSGTMNFSANNARRLIELGEQDARRLLDGSIQLASWVQTR